MNESLLGIAKKAGLLEIGEESVTNAARAGKAVVILSASDASDGSKRRAKALGAQYKAPHLVIPSTKSDLGAVIGRGLPGMLAVLDAGIAASYVSKLAKSDPEPYSDAASALNESAKRVLQRRREAKAHLRNKRSGKRRTNK